MYTYLNIIEENQKIEDAFRIAGTTADGIRTYRNGKQKLLSDITENLPAPNDADFLPLCKLGVSIACQICETRIAEEKGNGFHITRPDAAPDDQRAEAVRSYDLFLAHIKERNRLYIPDIIERTAPDDAKKIALQRRHDLQNRSMAERTQADNKALNRLFGSRG